MSRGVLLGYARVSTDEQSTLAQSDELKAAGCGIIHEEHASGGSRNRPVLKRILGAIAPGETLVVVRIDRLARSLSHLLQIIDQLESRGAFFRSLRDPIDTTSPQGKFTLQVLGAAAEFERSLIRERTMAGLKAAAREGRRGGNPGIRDGDPEAIRKIRDARAEGYFTALQETAEDWVPVVRRMRPHAPWEDVLSVINARLQQDRHWTMRRLLRAVHFYVRDRLLPEEVTGRAAPRREDRLPAIVGGIHMTDPALTLVEIGARLEAMRERTPRGGQKWSVSSVKLQLDRAKALGIVGASE
jgi:DNA invertase Pin-like site-specific DNA recombinase